MTGAKRTRWWSFLIATPMRLLCPDPCFSDESSQKTVLRYLPAVPSDFIFPRYTLLDPSGSILLVCSVGVSARGTSMHTERSNVFSGCIEFLDALIASRPGTLLRMDLGYVLSWEHDVFKSDRRRRETTFCRDVGDDFFEKLQVPFRNNAMLDASSPIRSAISMKERLSMYYRYDGTPFDVKVSFHEPHDADGNDDGGDVVYPVDFFTFVAFNGYSNTVSIVCDFYGVIASRLSVVFVLHRCFLIVRDLVSFLENIDTTRERIHLLGRG